MGGRGADGTAKIPSMGGATKSNAKYKGFSITRDGKTENYIVVKGSVQFADGRDRRAAGIGNIDQLETIQRAYDLEGNTKGLIERINRIGQAKATTLADKEVTKLRKKRDKEREEASKEEQRNAYRRKRGVNRHRAYWSAM